MAFTVIEPNIIKLPTRLNIKFQDISKDNFLAKMAQETQTMAPSYELKTKIGEVHSTVNLIFKRPVYKGYILADISQNSCASIILAAAH